MTRGRKPNLSTREVVPVQLNQEAVAHDAAAALELGIRSTQIAERYGDGTPYERHRVVSETRFFMGQSAEAMLETGKRLILIKENEPHGDFVEIVEQQLGIDRRAAQKMMQAAVKFLNPRIGSKAPPVALLGKSKLFVLMAEADDDLAELAAGGTLAGATLDDMQRMTRNELQTALREAKQTATAKDRLAAEDAAQIRTLREKLAAPWVPPEGSLAETQQQQSILDAMNGHVLGAQMNILQLATLVDGVFRSNAPERVHEFARAMLDYVANIVADLNRTHGIEMGMYERIVPEWVRIGRATRDQLEAEEAAKANAKAAAKAAKANGADTSPNGPAH